jgi:hypothetical protein
MEVVVEWYFFFKVNLIYCVLSDVLVLFIFQFKNIWLELIMIYTVAYVFLRTT